MKHPFFSVDPAEVRDGSRAAERRRWPDAVVRACSAGFRWFRAKKKKDDEDESADLGE